MMIKAHDTMTFAYNIMVCKHDIISTASNIMIKTRDTKTFAYDIMVCKHDMI